MCNPEGAGQPETGSGGNSELQALRCDCGRLIAKLVTECLELKCPRCKRTHRFRLPHAVQRLLRPAILHPEPDPNEEAPG